MPSQAMSSLSLDRVSLDGGYTHCHSEAVTQSQSLDGYEHEFDPPVEARYECPICLLVLREPCQTKCGHRFCKNCIMRTLRNSSTRCPIDNEPLTDSDIYPDNFAKREILNCTIKCPNKTNGCEKVFPLGKLNAHLQECQYSLVPCPYKCGCILLQRDVRDHVNNQCVLRMVVCTACGVNIPAQHTQDHVNVCPKVLVRCEDCDVEMTRDMVNHHIQTVCRNAQVPCPFQPLGCGSVIKRCSEDDHLQEETSHHLRQLCGAVIHILSHMSGVSSTQRKSLDPNHPSCEWQLPSLRSRTQDSGAWLHHSASLFASSSSADNAKAGVTPPTENNKEDSHKKISPEQLFHSCPQGVFADNTTVLAYSVAGSQSVGGSPLTKSHSLPNTDRRPKIENQGNLPFQSPYASQAPGHREGGGQLSSASDPGDCRRSPGSPLASSVNSPSAALAGVGSLSMPSDQGQHGQSPRVPQNGGQPNQRSYPQAPVTALEQTRSSVPDTASTIPLIFSIVEEVSATFEQKLEAHKKEVAHLKSTVSNLEKQNSDLSRTIVELQALVTNGLSKSCNGIFFWTICSFSLYKQCAQKGELVTLHSQPFYTNNWGYKMCLRASVTSPQAATGERSHQYLSLFVHLMQGDNDAILAWPFTGKIILAVMDQSRDRSQLKHVHETLEAKPTLSAFQRPTVPRNQKGFGFIEFMSVAAIEEGGYLVDNCLIIQAQVLPN